MQNFQDTFETCKLSFICSFLICMVVPLTCSALQGFWRSWKLLILNTYTNMACELASRLASRLDSYLYLLVALEIVLLPSFHDLL